MLHLVGVFTARIVL